MTYEFPSTDESSATRSSSAPLVWIGLLLLWLLLLSGCVGAPKATAPPPRAAQPEEPIDREGALPSDRERHRIALLLPESGENADVGTAIANATLLAQLDTRSDRIRITRYDTAQGGKAAAEQAIADGNKLILGPLLSDNVATAAPIARAAKVPMISFTNNTAHAGDGVFILGFVPSQSIARALDYAWAQGHRRFAALIPQSLYGDRALQSLRASLSEREAMLVVVKRYERTARSLSSAARQLASGEPVDAVLIADSGRTAARAVAIMKDTSRAALSYQILGTELWNVDPSLAGRSAMHGAWFASVSDRLYRRLAGRYRSRYNTTPYRISSLGYDAVLLTELIARDWRVGSAFPIARLYASEGFGGIDGLFRFNDQNIAVRALDVSEITASGFEVRDAAPLEW